MKFYGANSAGNDNINFMQWTKANEDITFYRDINIDTGYKLIIDTLSSQDATNLVIQRGGVNYMTLISDRISIANNILLAGDVITGSSIHGDMVYADSFRCRNYNVNTLFLGANVAETGRITFMTYRHLIEDIRYLRSITVDDTYKISSNIYDSNGNSDAAYKRNGVDFFYLRNNQVELNSGISLSTDGINCNEISSKPSSDLIFQRAGTPYMSFNQATDDITFYKNSITPVLNVGSNLFSLSVLINNDFELFDISNHSPTVGKTQAVRFLVGGASIAEAKEDDVFCYSTGGLKSDVVDTATNN